MSGTAPNDATTTTDRKPRALADIQLNTILAADQATSSEDERPEAQGIPAEDARTAIGISISQQQTRLTSPKTPAVEKAAAIDEAGGFFGGRFDGWQEPLVEDGPAEDEAESAARREERHATAGAEQSVVDAQKDTEQKQSAPHEEVRMPSPWKVVRHQKTRSGLLDGIFNRRRAHSGPDSTLESWQRSIMSSLPSMPKNFSLTSPRLPSHENNRSDGQDHVLRSKRSSFAWTGLNGEPAQGRRLQRHRSGSDSNALSPSVSVREQEEAEARVGDLPDRPALNKMKSRQSQLRRSASDTSLGTHRTMSRVSSLGDDTRFEHVQEQVNSRLKAIKDSWQDSNIRLPTFGSITSYRPEFLRERSGSIRKYSGVDSETTLNEKPTDPYTRQPYSSAKAAMTDAAAGRSSQHPHLNTALERLEGDVVMLGGYRGSILRSAEFPHRQLWVPIKVGLNLRKADLEVGLKEEDDERASEKIIPGGMLSHIGPIDISRRLFKRLRACDNARQDKLRVHDYGYDWRLHPLFLSKQLVTFLESLPCNQPGVPKNLRGATVIAHSLGGLITRHAVNQRPELFRGVVYAGVPHTCVNILGPMRNGDEVLLSSRVLTAQVNFSIRTSFALLPLEGRCFFDKNTKEEYPVDFFDPQTWIDYRLSPCVGRPLPPLNPVPEKPSGIAGYVSSMTNALPSLSLPGRKASLNRSKSPVDASKATAIGNGDIAEPGQMDNSSGSATVSAGNIDMSGTGREANADAQSPRTAVTIPREEAVEYLTRTLATVKRFKQELAFVPAHAAANKYPPVSVIYGKSTPTVYGAKVNGREGIKHADAYDELAFASGDGVVLARAAMVPEGYTAARGGVISSDRGHVTLLGDLEAVGQCLNAIIAARKRGVGCGM